MSMQDIRLREIWSEMRQSGEVSQRFKSLPVFRAWAMENGFTTDAMLVKLDPNGIFSETNCAFSRPHAEVDDDGSAVPAMIAQWDRAIDKLRQQLGLPPIMAGIPCKGCPKELVCERDGTVCKTRLRSWDAMTERMKKGGKQHE